MNRLISQKFETSYKATIGCDFSTKMMELNNRLVQAQIWDTAGQERFKSLSQSFYRGSDARVIVYDVTNPDSFHHVQEWKEEFLKYCNPPNVADFPFLILGNKCDSELGSEHQMRRPKVRNEIQYLVSAKTGLNIEQSFQKVVEVAAAQSGYDDVPPPPSGNGLFINGKIEVQPTQGKTCCE